MLDLNIEVYYYFFKGKKVRGGEYVIVMP